MQKRDELRIPSSCLNKTYPDEPVFILRANDQLAPQIVRLWCAAAEGMHEPEKITEAQQCAEEMEQWEAARPKAGFEESGLSDRRIT